jgi:hypothetical protein
MTKVLVHGFTDSGKAQWIIAMKNAYLDSVNIIFLNRF